MTTTAAHLSPLAELMATINAPVVREEESGRAELTVGRDDVIATLRNLLGNQRHTLLIGERGMGKSHLLRYAARELVQDPERLIVLDEFKAMKGILRGAIQDLHGRGQLARFKETEDSEQVYRATGRWRVNELAELACDSLHGHDYTIVIDNLEGLTPTGIPVLQQLSDVAVILAAARTDQLSRLDPVIERFNRVELRPITDEAVKELLWSSVDYSAVSNSRMLETKIVKTSAGVPGAVVDTIARYAAGQITIRDIQRIEGREPVSDVTWVLLFAIAGVMTLRYVSRAANSTTAYIAFGGLSAFSMVLRSMLYRLGRN
ncbi:MAG: ATP-binding protein [Anaerolineae bacterium]